MCCSRRTCGSTPAKRRTIPRSRKACRPRGRLRQRRVRRRPPRPRVRRRACRARRRKGAGLLLEKEVRELSRLLEPERPFAAILGGARRSPARSTRCELSRGARTSLLIGGGMANHFVRALGLSVGTSLPRGGQGPCRARDPGLLQGARKDDRAAFGLRRREVSGRRRARAATVGITKIPADVMALDVGQTDARAVRAPPRSGADDLLERAYGRLREAAIRPGHAARSRCSWPSPTR